MTRRARVQAPRAARSTSARAPSASRAPRDRALWVTVGLVLAILCVLADDRHAGLVADGRQMIRTAIAIVETGGIGQAVGQDFTIERPSGDAVSRFGLATSLLQVPAAWLAGTVEERWGPGRSQALFLIVPWLAVGVAAAAAGLIARQLGGSDAQVVAAVLLGSLASPLGSYAWLEFSEPVQAAALAWALAAALAAARADIPRPRLEYAAGLLAGLAVLAKSSLIAAAPFALLPMVDLRSAGRSRRALLRAAIGAAGPLTVWGAFELIRFGRFFGGYPDDRFTHPWLDGAWRLLVGPNRGLLLFWPALALFVWAGGRWRPNPFRTPGGRAWVAAKTMLLAHLGIAAGYWGWHGMEGWGPRLVLASVPVLAPFAACATARPHVLAAVVGISLLVNVPPLLQHPTPVATYIMNLAWPAVPEDEAPRYPFYATSRSPAGEPTVIPFAAIDREPAANPWRTYLWFWRATYLDGSALADRLALPPWRDARPDLVPAARWSAETAREVAPPPRWGFMGRSLTGTGGPYATVYLDALLDQVVRANQQGQILRALDLSERRLGLRPDGEAAAWRLETLRRAARAADAETLLRSLPESTRRHPLINVVLALFDRDGGEDRRARALLASVADSFPGTRVAASIAAPLTQWPGTLDEMTRAPRRDADVYGGQGRR